MEKDESSGMAHTLWRKYDSQSGRWTSPDPYGGSMTVGDPQSFNRYTYVNNDPVNQTDPLGLMSISSGGNYSPQDLFKWAEGQALFASNHLKPNAPTWIGAAQQEGSTTTVRPPAPEGYTWTKGGELAKAGGEAVIEETVTVAAKAAKRGFFKRILGRVAGFLGGFTFGVLADEMINPSQTVGGRDADLGPGVIPWAHQIQDTFMKSEFTPTYLEKDTVFYRVFDEGYMIPTQGVGYLTESLFRNSEEARRTLALSPAVTQNKASYIVAVLVPANTIVARGRAASQGRGYEGGGSQVVIENPRHPALRWGTPIRLP